MDVIIGEDHIITTIGLESQSLNRVFEEISKETDTIQVPYKSSPYYILYRIIDAFYNKTIKSLAVSSEKLLEIQTDIGNK